MGPFWESGCHLHPENQRHTGLLPWQAVAQILPFRDQNRKALDGLWNRHHVERVEIIMKETVDAEGE